MSDIYGFITVHVHPEYYNNQSIDKSSKTYSVAEFICNTNIIKEKDYIYKLVIFDVANDELVVDIIQHALFHFNQLSIIDFDNCKIKNVPSTLFENGVFIEELIFSGSSIEHIAHDTFKCVPYLKKLVFSGNNMCTLPANLFQYTPHIKNLRLTNNNFTSLPDTIFTGLNDLMYLDLSFNNLTSIPTSLKECLQLKVLNIRSNYLTSVCNYHLPKSIEYFNINDNKLISINTKQFKLLPNLIDCRY